ncbi:hypothetical protein LCGC14_0187620 [marine sediment metagenome]|uniref:CobW C-terminal domain-containing protein n=1 Tax=marine sediment metagenome TaxID=412755 RepID=A0A0F9UMU7_9ZZZZ
MTTRQPAWHVSRRRSVDVFVLTASVFDKARRPIRLTILTGFLGSGKTTLLNRLLRETAVTNTAVVVNEFGEAGIDQLLVETASSDGVIELSDGCLCCSVRGELVETLITLATRPRPSDDSALERVIIETTGLADPVPILASLMTHPGLLETYALDGVVAVVDRLAGARNLAEREEAQRQVAVADRIVLTKSDLALETEAESPDAAIAALNSRAPVIDAGDGRALASRLLNCGVYDPASGTADPYRWLGVESGAELRLSAARDDAHGADDSALPHHHNHDHAHDHHGAVRSFSIVCREPVAWDAIDGFLDLLRSTQGQRILRMKALVYTREYPERPVVLHGVQGYLHPPAQLPAWPAGANRETRIVLIGEALPETYVRDLFAAFTGGVRTDAPDRTALEANPLAVPGHRFV